MKFLTYLRKFLHSQWFVRIPYPDYSFEGQTVIVTGSNTGLGLEAARHLVRLGASKVILAVRTVSKGEAAAANILTSTKATKSTIEVWQLDISSSESIKSFVQRVQGLERLDAVIQNAGMNTMEWNKIEGTESVIQTNVIGPTLFTLGVLPKLRESAKKFGTRARFSIVGSDTHYVGALKNVRDDESILDALNDERRADKMGRYVQCNVTKIQIANIKQIPLIEAAGLLRSH